MASNLIVNVRSGKNEILKVIEAKQFDSLAQMKLESFRNGCASIQPSFVKAIQSLKKTMDAIPDDGNILFTDEQDNGEVYTVEISKKNILALKELYNSIKVENRPQRGRGASSGDKLGLNDL